MAVHHGGKVGKAGNPDCFDLVEWVLFDDETERIYEGEVDKLYTEM